MALTLFVAVTQALDTELQVTLQHTARALSAILDSINTGCHNRLRASVCSGEVCVSVCRRRVSST